MPYISSFRRMGTACDRPRLRPLFSWRWLTIFSALGEERATCGRPLPPQTPPSTARCVYGGGLQFFQLWR